MYNGLIQMPNILRESSSGYLKCSILEEMFRDREMECVGEITRESVYSLILQMRYLQKEDPDGPITMYINSPGGEVSSGLALYDVMQAVTCPIRTVCVGRADSMAALLFMSGDKGRREMLPHARLMIHDPLIAGGVGGSALTVNAVAQDLMKTREIAASVIARHTGHSLEEVLSKTAVDSSFDAEEALAWGLADRVIDRI